MRRAKGVLPRLPKECAPVDPRAPMCRGIMKEAAGHAVLSVSGRFAGNDVCRKQPAYSAVAVRATPVAIPAVEFAAAVGARCTLSGDMPAGAYVDEITYSG